MPLRPLESPNVLRSTWCNCKHTEKKGKHLLLQLCQAAVQYLTRQREQGVRSQTRGDHAMYRLVQGSQSEYLSGSLQLPCCQFSKVGHSSHKLHAIILGIHCLLAKLAFFAGPLWSLRVSRPTWMLKVGTILFGETLRRKSDAKLPLQFSWAESNYVVWGHGVF